MDVGSAEGAASQLDSGASGRRTTPYMNARHPLVSGIAACSALAASALMFGWLIKSSAYPDRPPLFAVVAFVFAIVAAATGLVLGVRTANGLMRASRDLPK